MTRAIERRLGDALRPLTPYLALRGARPTEQRIATAGLLVVTLGVLVWGLKQYLGGYLAEKGKQRAQMESPEDSSVEELRSVVRVLASEAARSPIAVTSSFEVDSEAMAAFLIAEYEVSTQKASQLASPVSAELASCVLAAIEEASEPTLDEPENHTSC